MMSQPRQPGAAGEPGHGWHQPVMWVGWGFFCRGRSLVAIPYEMVFLRWVFWGKVGRGMERGDAQCSEENAVEVDTSDP